MGRVWPGIHAKDYHNVAMTEGDKKFTVTVTDVGVILDVTVPIAVADLPKVVADAAVAAGGNGAALKSAIYEEKRANRNKVFDPPGIIYLVCVGKDGTVGWMVVAADGTVKMPLTLKSTTRQKDTKSQ